MDLVSIYQLLIRRRRVVLPASALVLVALIAVYLVVPPTYRASSSAVLLNPPTPPEAEIGEAVDPAYQNPYVLFGDISIVVDILRRVMTSDPVGQALLSQGLNGTFTVAANVDYIRGPLIDVAAEAGSEQDAIDDVLLVYGEMAQQLEALQTARGTDPQYFITSQLVVEPSRATRVFSSTLRRLIAVGVLGAGFVLGVALLDEVISRRRRRGGDAEEEPEPDDEPAEPALTGSARRR